MKIIEKLVCRHILKMQAYSTARNEFKGKASVFLDANENNFRKQYNRYPDPLQQKLKSEIGKYRNISTEKIFLGNGSDEAIDLLIRIFCKPERDAIITLPPTYGMYSVSAEISNVQNIEIPLDENFQPNVDEILKAQNEQTKILFICSPNNPTGNNIDLKLILQLIQQFKGIVVLDEAYIDFSEQVSLINFLEDHPNLVVLQTFSKARGLAAVRVGMAFANPYIISLINKIKAPYNLSRPAQEIALNSLTDSQYLKYDILLSVAERKRLSTKLSDIYFVTKVFDSQANFLMIKVRDAHQLYHYLIDYGIIVRNRSEVSGCHNCLRLTIGTQDENNKLLFAFSNFLNFNNDEKKSIIPGQRWDFSH
jgi:histidinol-phosphate aminotransferase